MCDRIHKIWCTLLLFEYSVKLPLLRNSFEIIPMDNFSLVDSTQFNCNALLCLLILRSSIAKLFFVRWFYAVRLQSSSSFVDSTQLDCKALFCSRCDKIQEIWRTLLSFEYGFQVSIVTSIHFNINVFMIVQCPKVSDVFTVSSVSVVSGSRDQESWCDS